MGGSETDKPAKEAAKGTPAAAAQEQALGTSTGTVNPEWPGYQGYAPIPPHGFIASSPQAHPYMWGVQHIMPPYGTPPHPYVAMYPHGMYAHPSIPAGSYPYSPFAMPSANGMTEASGNTPGNADTDGKLPEGKEKLPIKRSKGSLGSLNMITGKTNDQGKAAGPSANGTCSKSGESLSEGSSEGSDANSQNDSPINQANAPQNGSMVQGPQNGVQNTAHSIVNPTMPTVPISTTTAHGTGAGPTTNLNMGMDYWGTPATSAIPAMRGKVSSAAVAPGLITAGSHDNMQSQLWIQDERELKRQKRKQSNRESARRSRLRKQAECDELAQRAEALKEENANLRAELDRIRREHDQLVAENTALKERLGEIPEDSGTGKGEQNSVNDHSSEQTE